MYAQITTRCNMKCAHCCMNATAKGRDMTLETFKAVVDASSDCLTIGGGEPTLHPDFERFLFYALAHCDNVYMVTNGSQTERALVLAGLAKRGVLGVALSQDPWHDEIDDAVVEAFTRDDNRRNSMFGSSDNHDQREIRNVSNNPKGLMRVGRAARKSFRQDWPTYEDCACNGDPVIDPDGNVHQCGCPKAPIVGHITSGFKSMVEDVADHHGDIWCCYKEAQKILDKEEVTA